MQNNSYKLPKETVLSLAKEHGTPLYIYSTAELNAKADTLAAINMPYGFTPRYAVKANNNPEIIRLFNNIGLHFDASSSYEAAELISLGVEPDKISLSSQQPAHNLDELLKAGVLYTATSMHQLELFLQSPKRPDRVGVRINPGVGAGSSNRTTTGGPNSSFGLWHEYLEAALKLCQEQSVTINRLHIHFGSGANADIWQQVISSALEIVERLLDVTTLDIGGGFKIKRYEGEQEADFTHIAPVLSRALEAFARKTGRKLSLEIEPGTWLVGHAGTLIATVVDAVDTGRDGYAFLRLNTGMNDLIRPTMYGAQHEIEILNDSTEMKDYIVVGHNCETGDILTPAPGNSEELSPRSLQKAAIGDIVAIYDTGAYGRTFAVGGYNSFPSASEVVY